MHQPHTISHTMTKHNRAQFPAFPQDSLVELGKAHTRSTTSRCSFPKVAIKIGPVVIGTEEDSIHQQDRPAQVTICRLGTGHCQLLSHLHRLNISHSDECPCGTGPQTPNHILQSCPTFDSLRHQTWPSSVDSHMHRKLWGPVETLGQTADFALLTGLKI